MNCNINTIKGVLADNCANLAGIKEAWLGEWDEFVVTPTKESDVETHFATIAVKEGSSAKLYHYTFARSTGSLTSTLTKNEENGVRYYTNEVVLQFNRLEADKHLECEALAAGRLIAIILDNNGLYHIVGADQYLSAASQTAQTGRGFDELNGYTTTMNAMSAHLPYFIEYEDFESLVKA